MADPNIAWEVQTTVRHAVTNAVRRIVFTKTTEHLNDARDLLINVNWDDPMKLTMIETLNELIDRLATERRT